jgi:hypothetical protein
MCVRVVCVRVCMRMILCLSVYCVLFITI